METKFKYDVLRDCGLLEKNKSFENLFNLICAHGEVEAAAWLEKDTVKSLTFNELRQLADDYSIRLIKEFGTEGRVCICLDSCKEWFPIFWGLVRSGHDVFTVDASAPDSKLASLMMQANCTKLISARQRKLGAEIKQLVVSELENLPKARNYQPVWGHNIAMCTSGTTSDSRIFIYDEETICYLALFSAKVHDDNRLLIDDEPFRTLAFLPFHHILGFAAIFIWSHFLGDTTVYLKDRAPQTIVKTVKTCRVNQIVSVPLLANSLCKGLKANLRNQSLIKQGIFYTMLGISLGVQRFAPEAGLKLAGKMFDSVRGQLLGKDMKSIVLGGSHTDIRTLRLLNGIGYYTICGYGMTETAINSFETSFSLENRLKGSIGEPMLYTDFKIRDGKNEGELLIRGKGVHDGRFVNGEMLPPDVDADGWFATGDIVKVNKEKHQYFIAGRIKDVIVNESGENVYPDELEDLFIQVKGVEQYTILGTAKKGSNYEDITLAMYVGRNYGDAAFLDRLETEVVRINKTLPVFKRLTRAIVSADKLPLTNSFKVKRVELRRLINTGHITCKEFNLAKKEEFQPVKMAQAVIRDSQEDEIRSRITEIYAQILNIEPKSINPESNLIEDLGGDSLQVLSFASKAEEVFGVMIPAESYISCTTINGATKVIRHLVYGSFENNRPVNRTPVTNFEDTPEYKKFQKRMDAMLVDGAHNPYFVCHDSPLLDTSVVNGREMLDFGSYNYVGMSGRKEVSDAAKRAIDKYGTSASGSRLLAGEKPIHGELEREIAEWKHAESALVCVGGHSTNVTVVGNFCGKDDLILYDALAHNSVEQGCRLSSAMARPFPHNDVEALERILKAQRSYFEKVLIVIEGVYSMDGDISDVPAFVEIKKKYGCFLMVDEAHSACVLGSTGGGVDEYFGLAPDDIDIKMGTLSKGLGTCGGYIAGKKSVVEYLRYNLPGFVFSVGISPALAGGSLEAIRLLRSNPAIMESLHNNIKCFADEARKHRFDICLGGKAAVIPILVGSDEDAFALSVEMENRGVLVPPAVYPAVPRGKARLRFDVISEHKPEQIINALNILEEAARDLKINLPRRDY